MNVAVRYTLLLIRFQCYPKDITIESVYTSNSDYTRTSASDRYLMVYSSPKLPLCINDVYHTIISVAENDIRFNHFFSKKRLTEYFPLTLNSRFKTQIIPPKAHSSNIKAIYSVYRLQVRSEINKSNLAISNARSYGACLRLLLIFSKSSL